MLSSCTSLSCSELLTLRPGSEPPFFPFRTDSLISSFKNTDRVQAALMAQVCFRRELTIHTEGLLGRTTVGQDRHHTRP